MNPKKSLIEPAFQLPKSISFITGISLSNLKKLKIRFNLLDKDSKGHLSRDDLLAIPELAMNPLGKTIIRIIRLQTFS
jgi:Ca2+-binding EF-hand superfamily protein